MDKLFREIGRGIFTLNAKFLVSGKTHEAVILVCDLVMSHHFSSGFIAYNS